MKKQKGLARLPRLSGSGRRATAKGFTIIELIVVVAIIAVLSAVVIINVMAYINKGKNASIKANLSGMVTSSFLHFTQGISSYIFFCSVDGATAPRAAIMKATGIAANEYINNGIYYACNVNTAVQGNIPAGGAFCACAQEMPTTLL